MTLEQRRGADALDRIHELSKQSDEFKKRYRSYVDGLGPTIVMNGLGQALATELAAAGSDPRSASEQAHAAVYDSIKQWLCRQGGVYPPNGDLLDHLMKKPESYYLHAQAEALAWLEWHKKFCRTSFPKGEDE